MDKIHKTYEKIFIYDWLNRYNSYISSFHDSIVCQRIDARYTRRGRGVVGIHKIIVMNYRITVSNKAILEKLDEIKRDYAWKSKWFEVNIGINDYSFIFLNLITKGLFHIVIFILTLRKNSPIKARKNRWSFRETVLQPHNRCPNNGWWRVVWYPSWWRLRRK